MTDARLHQHLSLDAQTLWLCGVSHTRLPTLLDMNCYTTPSLVSLPPDLCLRFAPFSFSSLVLDLPTVDGTIKCGKSVSLLIP
jgi:hypothetical protein